MKVLIKANHSLDDIPDETREVVKEDGTNLIESRHVEKAILVANNDIRDLEERKSGHKNAVLVVNVHNRGKTDESLEVLGKVGVKCVGNKPLSSSLRVTEPDNLIEAFGMAQDVVDVCRNIILAHLMHGEVPERIIFNGVVNVPI